MDEQQLAAIVARAAALVRAGIDPHGRNWGDVEQVLVADHCDLVAEVRRLQHCSQCGAFQAENICLGCD